MNTHVYHLTMTCSFGDLNSLELIFKPFRKITMVHIQYVIMKSKIQAKVGTIKFH